MHLELMTFRTTTNMVATIADDRENKKVIEMTMAVEVAVMLHHPLTLHHSKQRHIAEDVHIAVRVIMNMITVIITIMETMRLRFTLQFDTMIPHGDVVHRTRKDKRMTYEVGSTPMSKEQLHLTGIQVNILSQVIGKATEQMR